MMKLSWCGCSLIISPIIPGLVSGGACDDEDDRGKECVFSLEPSRGTRRRCSVRFIGWGRQPERNPGQMLSLQRQIISRQMWSQNLSFMRRLGHQLHFLDDVARRRVVPGCLRR